MDSAAAIKLETENENYVVVKGKPEASSVTGDSKENAEDLEHFKYEMTIEEQVLYPYSSVDNVECESTARVISKRKLHCDECKKQFRDKKAFKLHISRHAKDKDEFVLKESTVKCPQETDSTNEDLLQYTDGFQCSVCLQEFPTRTGLRNHSRKHKNDSKATREGRSKSNPKYVEVSNAGIIHSKKGRTSVDHKCDICNKSFRITNDYLRHMVLHNKNNGFRCEFCLKLLYNDKGLSLHLKKHHSILTGGLRFFKCSVCQTAFRNEENLKKHQENNPLSCEECFKHFDSERAFTAHKRRHDGSLRKFTCDYCPKFYFNSHDCKKHMLKFHIELVKEDEALKQRAAEEKEARRSEDDDNYLPDRRGEIYSGLARCEICNQKLDSWNKYDIHALNSAPFGCKICHKHFSKEITSKEHMNVHTKVKIFQCEYCLKPYLMMNSLRTHIRNQHPTQVQISQNRIHSYFCSFSGCVDMFSQYKDLVDHIRVHKGDKPYRCDVCDRQFALLAHLEVHKKRRHENAKPYSCDMCQKPFFRKKFMMKHYNKHLTRPSD